MKKMKNPFKKQNVMATLVNVGIGGAGNVAIDYAVAKYNESATTKLEDNTVNLIKFVGGALGSAMVGNKYVKAALDGVGVVGASNYLSSLINDDTDTDKSAAAAETTTTSGVPASTIGRLRRIGRIRTGNAGYARRVKMSGTSDMVG